MHVETVMNKKFFFFATILKNKKCDQGLFSHIKESEHYLFLKPPFFNWLVEKQEASRKRSFSETNFGKNQKKKINDYPHYNKRCCRNSTTNRNFPPNEMYSYLNTGSLSSKGKQSICTWTWSEKLHSTSLAPANIWRMVASGKLDSNPRLLLDWSNPTSTYATIQDIPGKNQEFSCCDSRTSFLISTLGQPLRKHNQFKVH